MPYHHLKTGHWRRGIILSFFCSAFGRYAFAGAFSPGENRWNYESRTLKSPLIGIGRVTEQIKVQEGYQQQTKSTANLAFQSKIPRESAFQLYSQAQCTGTLESDETQTQIIPIEMPERIPMQEVTPKLYRILNKEEANCTIITSGYITRKRSFGSSLAFIDMVNSNMNVDDDGNGASNDTGTQPLQALLKRQAYNSDRTKSIFSSMLKSLHPGTKIEIEGFACPTQNPGEVVLLVTHLKFLKVSQKPECVKGMLQRMNLYMDGISDSDTGKRASLSGLDIGEFDGAFGPAVSVDVLKQVLRGNLDTTDLFPNEEEKKDTQKGNKRIPYARIARLIVENLPEDRDYPSKILNSKGAAMNKGDREGGRQGQYKALPVAPPDVKSIPSAVMNAIAIRNDDRITNASSILALLEEAERQGSNIHMDDSTRLLTVSGWVQNRRRFQGCNTHSIAVLELVEELAAIDSTVEKPNRLKCVLHPDFFQRDEDDKSFSILPSDAYGHLASKGSQVLLEGYYTVHANRPTLWVTKARLQRSTWRPATVKYMLDLLSGGDEFGGLSFNIEEVASALDMGHPEALDLMKFCKNSGTTERQWRAAELSRELQDSTSRIGILTDEMKAVLNQFSSARNEYPLENIDLDTSSTSLSDLGTMPMRRRQNASSLRKSSDGSRWRGKKRPQLEFMAGQVKKVVQSHPDFGSRPLNILDVGGGRGHLSQYLSSFLGNDVATVHVIDIDGRAIKNGISDAKRKGLNVRFGVGDASRSSSITDLLLDENEKGQGADAYDIVVALHACGALSDVALGHAVVNRAGFVITPCCFRSNPFLNVSVLSKKDARTNAYKRKKIRPSEWLDMKEESMVALTQAAEIQGDVKVAGKAIHTLCALRAKTVKNRFDPLNNVDININIKTFPIGFSTRNYCIVGQLNSNS